MLYSMYIHLFGLNLVLGYDTQTMPTMTVSTERCLGCQKTGIPLLACDDPDIPVPAGVKAR